MTTLISNPPYNMKWELPLFAEIQPRFCECELPPESNANYAFILTGLEKSQRCVFILPCAVLNSNNKQEEEIRKYLVEKNYIESIILCPDKMFESTGIATCILTLDKNKETTLIEMVDMRDKYDIEKREQNGQYGGSSHTNRTYTKEVKVFTDEMMEEAIQCIQEKEKVPGYCSAVSIEDVKERDYILSPRRYIESQETETKHREYKEIIADLNRVIADKNLLKLTINETFAKAIGLYDVYLGLKQSEEINKEMNKSLKFTGCEIIPENFISVTKNKNEIRFENNSKEKVSEIIMLVLNTWKQHIYYLNNEENRYLIELRDRLLPDLMSGKIKLE